MILKYHIKSLCKPASKHFLLRDIVNSMRERQCVFFRGSFRSSFEMEGFFAGKSLHLAETIIIK